VIAREDRFESKRVELNVSKSSPLYPTVRTSTRRAAASLIGQKATLDHLAFQKESIRRSTCRCPTKNCPVYQFKRADCSAPAARWLG
jgi:hypothetical protein